MLSDSLRRVLVGIADEYGTIWVGEPGASERLGDLVLRADEETSEVWIGEGTESTWLKAAERWRAIERHLSLLSERHDALLDSATATITTTSMSDVTAFLCSAIEMRYVPEWGDPESIAWKQ